MLLPCGCVTVVFFVLKLVRCSLMLSLLCHLRASSCLGCNWTTLHNDNEVISPSVVPALIS